MNDHSPLSERFSNNTQRTNEGPLPSIFRRRYGTALLLIALLATSSFFLTKQLLVNHQKYSSIINLAGRQRMLSQKISLHSLQHIKSLQSGNMDTNLTSQLLSAADLMSNSHLQLTETSMYKEPMSPALSRLYFDGSESLDERITKYSQTARNLASVSSKTGLVTINLDLFEDSFVESLLKDLNRVVEQYEIEAHNSVETLEQIETFVWLIIILVLLLEAILIFRPMEHQIQAAFQILVSERLNAQELQQKAEAGDRAKSEFLATLSHEIRTPLNGLLGMLNLLDKSTLDHKQKHQLSTALDSGKHLFLLLSDIIDFSKIETGNIEINHKEFNLCELLEDAVDSLAQQAHEKYLELILDTAEIQNDLVISDATRIRQIVINLLSNAIKFTAIGEIEVKARLLPKENNMAILHLSVRDSGIGISNETQANIFGLFTQVNSSSSRSFDGMGLGLAVVKRLCQRMGGDVIVDSELGKGSCFMCSLPVGQPDAIAPKATYKTLTELRALVIEDNATQRAALVRHLEQFGLHCAETDSVNAAISNYLKRTQHDASLAFNIVYLNIELVVDDLSVLASMIYEKTQLAGVKLILTGTQNAFKKTDVIAEKKGMRFLSKPFTKKSILATLNVTDNKPLGNTSNADNTYSDNKHSDNKHSDKNVSDLSHLQSEPNERPSIFNSARILLVEDNEVNQEVASYILEDENFQFDIASNGLEALEALAKPCDSSPNNKSYALVLMDCQMPKMDGYETTRNIRKGSVGEHIKNIPIIAMTANTLHGDEQKCRDAGMDDYLAKPIDADTVISKIYYWLEKSNHIKNAAGN